MENDYRHQYPSNGIAFKSPPIPDFDELVESYNYYLWLFSGVAVFIIFVFGVLRLYFRDAWPFGPEQGQKNFPYSPALPQCFFTTSSAWRLDRLDKYKKYRLNGAGTVIAILDTAVYNHCPLLDFVQIEARHDLSSVSTNCMAVYVHLLLLVHPL